MLLVMQGRLLILRPDMKPNALKKFVLLRRALLKEKAELEIRLEQINQALAPEETKSGAVAKRGRTSATGEPLASPGRRLKRVVNTLSLRGAVLRVTKEKPLTKSEILAAVLKDGYKFRTKTPRKSLDTLLYGGKGLKNHGGKFGPA